MTRTGVMKALYKLLLIITGSCSLTLSGCADPNVIFDQSTPIENRNWSYANRIKCAVNVNDNHVPYRISLRLRVTGDYRYSNIFILLRRNGPELQAVTRFEVKLALPDGQWLGKGSGNLYDYQVPLITDYLFPAKGSYQFQIEQNMRDNPLHEVSDVGLEVEKSTAR